MTPRNLRTPFALLTLAAALAVSGCHKSNPTPETKTEAKPAAADSKDARKSSARGQPDEGVEVPTEEDFEDQAEKDITATSNLQKELDQIEKQISGG